MIDPPHTGHLNIGPGRSVFCSGVLCSAVLQCDVECDKVSTTLGTPDISSKLQSITSSRRHETLIKENAHA